MDKECEKLTQVKIQVRNKQLAKMYFEDYKQKK